nr:uncharacterized protein LOC106616982 isoform X2 [Bactrocera oleae]
MKFVQTSMAEFQTDMTRVFAWRELVRKNWQSLRDQYRRDVKKQMVDGIEPSWVFFDDMVFIRKFLRTRKFKACPDSEENEIVRRRSHARYIKTRSYSQVIPTTDTFMTQIFHTANDHSTAAVNEQQEQQESTVSPPLVNSAIRLHRPIKMEVDNESVETIIYNASMEPPNETVNGPLVQREQIPKNPTNNLKYAKTGSRVRRKRRAVRKTQRAQFSTRCRSRSNINEICTAPLTSKISNIGKNVSCISDVLIELTDSQLGNGAESTPGKQSQQTSPLSNVNKSPTNIEIPSIEIKDEVEILEDENSKVADTAATSENSTNIMEPECSINNKSPTEFTNDTSKTKEIGKEPTDKEDDDYHFVISLLPTLRRITHDRKLKTRMEIMKAVMAAAQSDNI